MRIRHSKTKENEATHVFLIEQTEKEKGTETERATEPTNRYCTQPASQSASPLAKLANEALQHPDHQHRAAKRRDGS